MGKRDILSIGLKIVGVTSILSIVSSLTALVTIIGLVIRELPSESMGSFYWMSLGASIVALILYLVFTYILLKYADAISIKLIKEDKEISLLAIKGGQKDVFILSLRIVGVIYLISSIISLMSFLLLYVFPNISTEAKLPLAGVIKYLILLTISCYLISGGKHLVNYIFRNPKPDEPLPQTSSDQNPNETG